MQKASVQSMVTFVYHPLYRYCFPYEPNAVFCMLPILVRAKEGEASPSFFMRAFPSTLQHGFFPFKLLAGDKSPSGFFHGGVKFLPSLL